jgi:hypothetical protein
LTNDFQQRVAAWLTECFGVEAASDRAERAHRFLEEALELAQAAGCSRDEAIALVEYVFSRPPGGFESEVGGTLVTLSGLCTAHAVSLTGCGETELQRNEARTHHIRQKWARKPAGSPLPE